MKMKVTVPCLIAACATGVSAITIEVDYTYDTNNFFNTPQKRAAIEAAAKFYGDLLNDNFLEINKDAFGGGVSWTARFSHPGTGAEQQIPSLIVPEDTIIVFVGGRVLAPNASGQGGPGGFSAGGTQEWFDRIRGRGNAGALATPRTDFAPWGGSITFNTTSTWNFSLAGNAAGTEFISIALHELGHVLGVGASEVWNALTATNFFVGPAATQSWGGAPPAFNSHLQHPGGDILNSPLFGSFEVTHGLERPPIMLPLLIDNGSNFDVITDLDLSVLFDLGWEVYPRIPLKPISLTPSNASFEWSSTSFLNHRVERGDNLISFPDGSSLAPGNGFVQAWSDPSPPASRAFYRLFSQYNLPAQSSLSIESGSKSSGKHTFISVEPIVVECRRHDHGECGHEHE